MEHKCAHCAKKKERTEKEYKDLINRLNRIEGQVDVYKRQQLDVILIISLKLIRMT